MRDGEAGSRRGETEASDAGAASGGRRGKDKKALPVVRGASRRPGGRVARVGQMRCVGALLPAEALTSSARPHRVSVCSGRCLASTVPLQSRPPTRL